MPFLPAFSPRPRAWLAAPVLGTVLALGSVVLPAVTAPPSTAPPPVAVERTELSGASTTLHPGWSARTAAPANLVGVTWKGDPTAQFQVERRGSDGRWRAVGAVEQEDDGPDPGTVEYTRAHAAAAGNVSTPLWVGKDASEVRVRLTAGSARAVALTRVETPEPAPSGSIAGAATMPLDGVISRPQWGADENLRLQNCPEGPTIADNVKVAVVHHTAGNNNYGPGDSAAIVRGLYGYATQTLKYCDTHYNFFIDKYGQIFEGRYGGISNPVLAAHATGMNWDTVGIALIGNYTSTPAPAAMISSLEALIAAKLAWHGIDPTRTVNYASLTGTDKWPAGQVHTISPIVGHRDPGQTSCPGDQVYNRLPEIRANVAARILNGPVDVVRLIAPEPGKAKLVVASGYGGLYPAGGSPSYRSPATFRAFSIIRDVALLPGGGGGYLLDGYGGLHPFGGAPRVADGPYWYGWDIARDVVLRPEGGGYVLDGYGGIHPFGGAPPIAGAAYWPGFDIAKRLALFADGAYTLDGYGGIHPAAGAPRITDGPYWNRWNIARDLVAAPGGHGGYLLDGYGGVFAVGGAPALGAMPYWGADWARGLVVLPGGSGGYVLDISGTLTRFGSAPPVKQSRATYVNAPAVTSPYSARAVAFAP
jgi:hypothetical protein